MADNDQDITEADVNKAVARAFGRQPAGPSEFDRVVEESRVQRAEDQSVAPWRAGVWLDEREALINAEEHLAELYSTRRGQSMEAARRTVEASLREAWFSPGGLGLSLDPPMSVVFGAGRDARMSF